MDTAQSIQSQPFSTAEPGNTNPVAISMVTNDSYDVEMLRCKEIFINKFKDYGTSWRVLRPVSLSDQVFIKAKRIRAIQEAGSQKIHDSVASEFRAMINYSVIYLIQDGLPESLLLTMQYDILSGIYDKCVDRAKKIMIDKNHDYGEAWRLLSQESFVDLILMKLLRIKQIIVNKGMVVASEGIDANYIDIINYSVFALILMADDKW